jgi:hypothetical protein
MTEMTKRHLELLDFGGLAVLLKEVAENERSTSLEADQARELIADQNSDRYIEIRNDVAFGDKTVGEVQIESLKRRTADFLFATRNLWTLKCLSR